MFCQCIRCRQVENDSGKDFILVRREYEASEGREIFLSFESSDGRALSALLRLRIKEGKGLVRELHTYGWHLPVAEHQDGSAQHQGFGKRLMEKAERIAKEEFGISRIKVIAGVGVRGYYRKLGYQEEETYMVKDL